MSSVKGMAELISKLKAFGSETDNFLKQEIAAAGFQIAADAKENISAISSAPPEVKQMISNTVSDGGYTSRVTQNALPMGAYIEFGTGVYITVAPEWRDMAWQFYVNGKGRLKAHPYMYPAFIKGRDDFMNTLNKKLGILVRNFNK